MSPEYLANIISLIEVWNNNEASRWVSSHMCKGFVLSVYIADPTLVNLWHFCNVDSTDFDRDAIHGINELTWKCGYCEAKVPMSIRSTYKLLTLEI